jgi:hypothetical protein
VKSRGRRIRIQEKCEKRRGALKYKKSKKIREEKSPC